VKSSDFELLRHQLAVVVGVAPHQLHPLLAAEISWILYSFVKPMPPWNCWPCATTRREASEVQASPC